MKKIIGGFIVGLMLVGGLLMADTGTIGSMWKQDGATVTPSDDVTEVDLSGVTATGVGTVMSYGELGSTATVTLTLVAADTFYKYTSFNTTVSSTNITGDISAGTLTLDADLSGVFSISEEVFVQAPSGTTLTMGYFQDGTSTHEATHMMGEGVTVYPSLANLSGSDGWLNYSSVSRLRAADFQYIDIDESTQTPAFVVTFTFEDMIVPKLCFFNNAGYDGAAGHNVKGQFYNATQGRYTSATALAQDFTSTGTYGVTTAYNVSYEVPSPKSDYVDGSGNVLFRAIHTTGGTTAHIMYFDEVGCVDLYSDAPITFFGFQNLSGGDVVDTRLKSDKANTLLYINHIDLDMTKIGN